MARPKFTPTENQRHIVKTMAAMGIQQEKIAAVIGCRSEKTLRKHFGEELDRGATEANCQVAKALYTNAVSGNVAAQIFWMKTRAGWKERPGFEAIASAPPPFIVNEQKGTPV